MKEFLELYVFLGCSVKVDKLSVVEKVEEVECAWLCLDFEVQMYVSAKNPNKY